MSRRIAVSIAVLGLAISAAPATAAESSWWQRLTGSAPAAARDQAPQQQPQPARREQVRPAPRETIDAVPPNTLPQVVAPRQQVTPPRVEQIAPPRPTVQEPPPRPAAQATPSRPAVQATPPRPAVQERRSETPRRVIREKARAPDRRPVVHRMPPQDQEWSGPVRVVNAGGTRRDYDEPRYQVVRYGASYRSHGVTVVAPLPVYAEDGTGPIFPYMHTDPAWKLCQFDGRHRRSHRYTHCGPYSYHPYGLYGYRPFGSYRPYVAAPAQDDRAGRAHHSPALAESLLVAT